MMCEKKEEEKEGGGKRKIETFKEVRGMPQKLYIIWDVRVALGSLSYPRVYILHRFLEKLTIFRQLFFKKIRTYSKE